MEFDDISSSFILYTGFRKHSNLHMCLQFANIHFAELKTERAKLNARVTRCEGRVADQPHQLQSDEYFSFVRKSWRTANSQAESQCLVLERRFRDSPSFQNIWYSVVIFHHFVFCYYWDFKNPLLSVRHFRVFVATVRGGTVCKTIRNKLVLL